MPHFFNHRRQTWAAGEDVALLIFIRLSASLHLTGQGLVKAIPVQKLLFLKPQLDLPLCPIERITGMNHVPLDEHTCHYSTSKTDEKKEGSLIKLFLLWTNNTLNITSLTVTRKCCANTQRICNKVKPIQMLYSENKITEKQFEKK